MLVLSAGVCMQAPGIPQSLPFLAVQGEKPALRTGFPCETVLQKALVGFLLVGGFLSAAGFSSFKFWACSSVFTCRNICPLNGFGATQVFSCSFSLDLTLMMNVPAWIVAARAAGSTSHRTHSIGAGKPHVCQEILGCLGCVLLWVLGTKPFPGWCLPCSNILFVFEGLEIWFWVASVKPSVPLKYLLLVISAVRVGEHPPPGNKTELVGLPCPLAGTRSRSSLQDHRACLLLGQSGSLESGLGRHHLQLHHLRQGEEKPCRLVTEGCSRVYGSHWMAAPRGKQEGKELEGNLAFPICYSTWGWLLILGYRVYPRILLGLVF